MIIEWSPTRSDGEKIESVSLVSETEVEVNGITYYIVDCPWVISVTDNVVTLMLPHDVDASELVRFPDPVVITGPGEIWVPKDE
jgi:hypothetical protein